MLLFRSQTRWRFAAVAAWLLVIAAGFLPDAPAALALEGVIEVNNALVTQNGGFPFVISQSGTYRLTGSLAVTSGVDGIDVNADNVTIDLNGFAIVGSGGGAGIGIKSTNNQVTVRNGTVTGMGGDGISLGANATVTDVHAVNNGGDGIMVGDSSLVTHNTVSSNTGIGIYVNGKGSTVVGNSVYNNSSYGLALKDISSSFAHNVFMGNDGNPNVGSSVPPQVDPPPSGSTQVQIGPNLCNGVACP
jgi:hypothetical protein